MHYTKAGRCDSRRILWHRDDGRGGTECVGPRSDLKPRYEVESEGRARLPNQNGVFAIAFSATCPRSPHSLLTITTSPVDSSAIREAKPRCLQAIEEQMGGCMRRGIPREVQGRINYTVWSEVFRCQHCGKEVVYLNKVYDLKGRRSGTVSLPQMWRAGNLSASAEEEGTVLRQTLRKAAFGHEAKARS